MATAHMTYGYLGAGKSTLAKELEVQHRAVRFSPDDWMVQLYGTNPPAEKFSEYYQNIDSIITRYWTRCLELGTDVILDFGFWSRASRDKARETIRNCGAEAKLYFVECSDRVMWERCNARNENLIEEGSLYIDPNTFEIFRSRFEALGPDEDFERR